MSLTYQPIISLATNRIVAVEALLPPGRDDRATTFGESVRQASVWHRTYPKTPVQLAINVTPSQFGPTLAGTLRKAVDEVGLRATFVCLQIAEATVMANVDRSVEILADLSELGFMVSIDGLGAGYSSLNQLLRLPIDEVKIDRSFITGLGSDRVNTTIVASIIGVAHAMDLEVVADGVETSAQLERLQALGCDFAQGSLIAAPMLAREIDEYLAADPTGGVVGLSVNETVLVVDDVADVRMLLTMSLSAAGFTVEEASTGAAALKAARRLVPTCVLLDVGMPDMSGIEVCRALRDDPATADCTIVMLTTNADATDKAEAFLVGADDYIVKPFTPRDLVARIRSAVHRRQTTIGAVGRRVDAALLEMLHTARARERGELTLTDAEHLSSRQIEIVKRLLGGERVPTIARGLFVSQSTVRNHLSAVYQRVGVHSQDELLGLLRKSIR